METLEKTENKLAKIQPDQLESVVKNSGLAIIEAKEIKTGKLKLVEQIIRSTTSFSLNHIDYLLDLTAKHIKVWQKYNVHGSFMATEIIKLFEFGFSTYIQYDEENKRCELVIF